MEKQSVTNDVSYLFATLYSICYLAFFYLTYYSHSIVEGGFEETS